LRQSLKLQKHTVRLFAGDMEELSLLFPSSDSNKILRDMLHAFLEKVRNGEDRSAPLVDTDDIKV
jgi:hypothetical protein